MAKSLHLIEMDFKNAIRQAENLERIAKEIENLLNGQFDSCMNIVSGNWRGENASSYIRKGNIVREDICCEAKKIRDTAAVVREIARRLYEADMRAYRLARKRKH